MLFNLLQPQLQVSPGCSTSHSTQVAEQAKCRAIFSSSSLSDFALSHCSKNKCLKKKKGKSGFKWRKLISTQAPWSSSRTKMHVEQKAGKQSSLEGWVEGTVRQERGHLVGKNNIIGESSLTSLFIMFFPHSPCKHAIVAFS